MPDEVAEGCDERGDIRPTGGIERTANASFFAVGADTSHVSEDAFGAAGCVELHREGDQVKHHDRTPGQGEDAGDRGAVQGTGKQLSLIHI